MELLRRGIEWVVDLLFPIWCVSCQKEGEWWCEACIKKDLSPTIFAEGHIDRIVALFAYDEHQAVGKLIRQFKYHHAYAMRSLWEKVVDVPLDISKETVVVPVPLYKNRMRERGYNQAGILAAIIAAKYDLQLSDVLTRVRPTEQQAKLGRESRFQNMEGAFNVQLGFTIPTNVLLIDDVYTTGATLQQCAMVLKQAGVQNVSAFTLARG